MLAAMGLIGRDPTLRMAALAAFCFGSYIASIGPYQSLVATRVFGMSDAAYSALLVGALISGVIAAVGVGILTDQRPNRRRMAINASIAAILGGLLVGVLPSTTSFVLAHVLVMPLSGTVFGQVFAVARLSCQHRPAAERDAILGGIRAVFALPFVVILPLWGWAADFGLPLLAIYGGLALIGLAQLVLILTSWPPDETAPWTEVKSGLGFRASLAEMLAPAVFLRVQLFGALQAGGALVGILIGLTFAAAGRSTGEVGLFFAIFVAFEVLGTMFIGQMARLATRATIMTLGVAIYAVFLALLPVWAGSPLVWLLVVLGGFGGAMIYTFAIAYLQDLLGARAGAGASLLALQRISTDSVSAGAFWLGTLLSGYGLAALIGAAVTMLAMTAVLWLDRARTQAA